MHKKGKETQATNALSVVEPPSFYIVGIGASAGGLAAFEALLSALPADAAPNMAFVLVQHLAPDCKSLLPELIQHRTRLTVFEVVDGLAVKPNCVYVAPPNHDVAILHGTLQLLPTVAPHGLHLPIDFFFRSLALDQHERSIGIILSGTASDGTLGVRAIKGEGGLVMAQAPQSAEYDGMPRSAIASGMVDYVLPAAEMLAQLRAYISRDTAVALPQAHVRQPSSEDYWRKIFILVRAQTGHDFSQYKPSTILRRIERRMLVHQIETLEAYVRYLQQTPAEVEALFQDFLIGVTAFFRDRDAFAALQGSVIAHLATRTSEHEPLRIWVPGCSTGEEAYSIAILVQEQMERQRLAVKVQIFASDIDRRAIEKARAGSYPVSIAADVSTERLNRFFTSEAGETYRVHKRLRDMMVFSVQDLIRDPPFSRMDLISCRNIMIYMGAPLQKRLIPLFRYALNPEGYLFLGTAETVGEFADLFAVVDGKARIYQRKQGTRTVRSAVPEIPTLGSMRGREGAGGAGGAVGAARRTERVPLCDVVQKLLLEQYAPASLLLTEHGEILYLFGRAGQYLEPADGEAGLNVYRMACEGLRSELTMALHQAISQRQTICHPSVSVKTRDGQHATIKLTVRVVGNSLEVAPRAAALYLISLEECAVLPPADPCLPLESASTTTAEDAACIAALRKDLRTNEAYLQTANEQLATVNAELTSSNEEMQSLNEELQSSNEELETSKEELQSVNEELATVNAELQAKVTDLTRANNDMNNLFAGTEIGTIFVDHQLRILRFTPAVTQVINLIAADVGRPVGHIVSNLIKYEGLVADVQEVLNSLIPRELEVHAKNDTHYLLRIRPYRTLENVIEGAVITFTEITALKRMQGLVRAAEGGVRRLAAVVHDSHDAVLMMDLTGQILAWNPAASRMYGWSEAEAMSRSLPDLVPPVQRAGALATIQRVALAGGGAPILSERQTKDGRKIKVWVTATLLSKGSGEAYAFATSEREQV
jgi:two-component system CheB/CheR fusion protein